MKITNNELGLIMSRRKRQRKKEETKKEKKREGELGGEKEEEMKERGDFDRESLDGRRYHRASGRKSGVSPET